MQSTQTQSYLARNLQSQTIQTEIRITRIASWPQSLHRRV
jgi:hypothetical protein